MDANIAEMALSRLQKKVKISQEIKNQNENKIAAQQTSTITTQNQNQEDQQSKLAKALATFKAETAANNQTYMTEMKSAATEKDHTIMSVKIKEAKDKFDKNNAQINQRFENAKKAYTEYQYN